MCLWVSLLSVNETGEEHGISNEENWCVIANHVPVAIISVKLDSEATGVTSCISRSALTSNSGKSNTNWCPFSDTLEHTSPTVFCYVMSHLEVAKSTCKLKKGRWSGMTNQIYFSPLILFEIKLISRH